MLNYIQTGLEKQGYRGILSWEGLDRYRDNIPEDDDWEIRDSGESATAIMFAKDGMFEVTLKRLPY